MCDDGRAPHYLMRILSIPNSEGLKGLRGLEGRLGWCGAGAVVIKENGQSVQY